MARQYHFVYLLSFGSNVGDRMANLLRGRTFLARYGVFQKESGWIKTEPLASDTYDVSDHDFYLNGVLEFASELSPIELYGKIWEIEDCVGHRRDKRWAPRELDIDILFVGASDVIERTVECARECDTSFANARALHFVGPDGFRVPHADFWNRPFLIDLVVVHLDIPREILLKHENVMKNEENILKGNS